MLTKSICAALFGAAVLMPAGAFAADASGEITTAMTHAGLAAGASDLAGVQMHLHHAVNCLVGPKGRDFDPKNMNPCANSGNGAIPDTADAAKKAQLAAAVTTAETGIAATDIATAKKAATATADQLKAVK